MKKMVFYIFLILVLTISIIFTFGCKEKQNNQTDEESDDKIREKVENIENSQDTKDQKKKKIENEIEDIKNDIEENMKEEKGEKQEETHKSDKNDKPVDFGEFAKLDNTKKAWWFRRSQNHKPASTDKSIEVLIEKYGGIYIHHTNEKLIYLTFDEGYEMGYTPSILDTLKENNVKAAFFITGGYLKSHPELVERMVKEGHIVGNHTVNHPSLPEVGQYKKLEEEILGLERDYYEMFNKKMSFLRPPKGEYSERTLAITHSLGYNTVFWSFAYADWDTNNQKGADYAYEKVMKELHNGEVMLLHAVSKDNAEALDSIIKNARKLGYEFSTLDKIKGQ